MSVAAGEWVVLHGGALGDLALTLQLALRLPGVEASGRLALISRVSLGELRVGQTTIRCHCAEGGGLHWLFTEHPGEPPPQLMRRITDRCVLNALSGPGEMVHRRLTLLRPQAVYSFDPRPIPGCEQHITAQWRQRLEAQGLALPDLGEIGDARPPGQKRNARGGAILIHPGSGAPRKCWPLANFLEVGRRLAALGRAVRFLAGPVEQDLWPPQTRASITAEFELLEPQDAAHLALRLREAAVLVGNDSGPAHLAALLGTPTVTLFGPTPHRVWRPIGPAACVLAGAAQRPDWGIPVGKVVQCASEGG